MASAGMSTNEGFKLFNDHVDVINDDAVQQFINDTIKEPNTNGYGFVALIGAGLSAPSGVPLIWEIRQYLQRCIALALGTYADRRFPWNPRTDQWPPFVDRTIETGPMTPSIGVGDNVWETCIKNEFDRRQNLDPADPFLRVLQEARGAMAEWRTALQFLSRVVHETSDGRRRKFPTIVLGAPNPEVIDACLREAMKDKEPALGHRMVAILSAALRMDIIVTTNFDDLLEKAFVNARRPLTPYELHVASTLPPSSALSNQRALIKLHGGRHSLRADFTLDALSSESDRWRFLDYLLTPEGRRQAQERRGGEAVSQSLPFRNHLLIFGFSARERRTQSLIEHAWTHLDKNFRVVWICHTAADVAQVRDFTRSYWHRMQKASGEKRDDWDKWIGSQVLRHPDLGLLFLQIFQLLRHGIPNHGIVFPSVSRLSLPPLPRPMRHVGEEDKEENSKTVEEPLSHVSPTSSENGNSENQGWENINLIQRYEEQGQIDRNVDRVLADLQKLQSGAEEGPKLLVVTTEPGVAGATSTCGRVFEKLRYDNVCLWLDMDDISSSDDLFERLLDASHYRLGLENSMPTYVADDPVLQAAEIRRVTEHSQQHWIFFLNARELPGGNYLGADRQPPPDPKSSPDAASEPSSTDSVASEGNGWLDCELQYLQFSQFVSELCGERSPRLAVVLLCRAGVQKEHDGQQRKQKPTEISGPDEREHQLSKEIPPQQKSLFKGLEDYGLLPNGPLCLDLDATSSSDTNVVAQVKTWAKRNLGRLRFLSALAFMQRARYFAAIWNVLDSKTPGLRNHDSGDHSDKTADGHQSAGTAIADPPTAEIENQDYGGWLKELERKGLIRRKYGGFIWMRARARNQLREWLSTDDEGWDAGEHLSKINESLAQWYRRVLTASDTPSALFEAVYHACQSARFVLKRNLTPQKTGLTDRPGSDKLSNSSDNIVAHSDDATNADEAVTAVLSSANRQIAWALNILQTHRSLVQNTDYPRASARRLKYIRETLCGEILREARDDPTLERTTRGLQIECAEIARSIERECNDILEANKNHQEVDRLHAPKSSCLAEGETELQQFASGPPRHIPLGIESLRWLRWSAMLAITARSYDRAAKSFQDAAEELRGRPGAAGTSTTLQTQTCNPNRLQFIKQLEEFKNSCDRKREPPFEYPKEKSSSFYLEVSNIIEQFVELELLKNRLGQRLSTYKEAENSDTSERAVLPVAAETTALRDSRWTKDLENLIKLGKEFVERALAESAKARVGDTSRAIYCMIRLFMHESVCTALSPKDEAIRRLADAEAYCAHDETPNGVKHLALIELYRAQVRLARADHTKVNCQVTEQVKPEEWQSYCANISRKELFKRQSSTFASPMGADSLRQTYLPTSSDPDCEPLWKEGFDRARTNVADALRFLDRAEHILRGRRRNVWWMSWFLQRKLSAIAKAIWCTLPEKGTIVPFVGLESSPRNCPTIVDRMLDDAIRLTRFDSYRLATIIEAYSDCALAMRMRLLWDPTIPRLDDRQEAMYKNLCHALEVLESIPARRIRAELSRSDEKPDSNVKEFVSDLEPDGDVNKFVSNVSRHMRKVIAILQTPVV